MLHEGNTKCLKSVTYYLNDPKKGLVEIDTWIP
jgi:hypothetical protein